MRFDEGLDAGWLELASDDELVIVCEPEPDGSPDHLVYERHEDSTLFSAAMLAQVATTTTTTSALAATAEPTETFVPIALPGMAASPSAVWLWRSLAVATAALLLVFVAALDLLIAGVHLR